jgi:hypothetical protein
VLGRRWLAGERVVAYSATACQLAFRGGDPTEPLALARLACQVPTGGTNGHEPELLATVDRLLAESQDRLIRHPDEPRGSIYPAMAANLLAGTPRVRV